MLFRSPAFPRERTRQRLCLAFSYFLPLSPSFSFLFSPSPLPPFPLVKTWTHLSQVTGAPDKSCLSLSICLSLRLGSLTWSWDSAPPLVSRTVGLKVPNVRFSFKVLNFNFCPESLSVSADVHLADRRPPGINCGLPTAPKMTLHSGLEES